MIYENSRGLGSTVSVAELTPVCLRCYLSRESLPFYINASNKDCVVKPDNFGHDVINFGDMRLVDVLTRNPVQVGDSLIRSSKSRELVRFLPQVAVHRNEIISFNEVG